MPGLDTVVEALRRLSVWEALGWLLLENWLIFGLALLIGKGLVGWFKARPVSLPPVPGDLEIGLAISSVILNSLVTVMGFVLWQQNIIVLRTSTGLRDWLDIAVLFFVMDFFMYVLHRVAHLRLFYRLLHQTHHRFEEVRPLTLFALNPLETLSFGLLWLVVLCVYQASWLGISVYLALNVVFGLIGHLGVEPFPQSWVKIPVIKYLSTSTFHAQHHQEAGSNFGFYTLIWDKLFGTLSWRYPAQFGQMPSPVEPKKVLVG